MSSHGLPIGDWGHPSCAGNKLCPLCFQTRGSRDEVQESPSKRPQPGAADRAGYQPGEAGERQDLPRSHPNFRECSLASPEAPSSENPPHTSQAGENPGGPSAGAIAGLPGVIVLGVTRGSRAVGSRFAPKWLMPLSPAASQAHAVVGPGPGSGLGAPYPDLGVGESGFLWAGVTLKPRDFTKSGPCADLVFSSFLAPRLAPETVLVPRAALPIPLQASLSRPRAEVSGQAFSLILLGPKSLSCRFTTVGRQLRTRQNAA